MAGLKEVGLPGREALREALTNCTDPLRAIEEFQEENAILLPSLRPMLSLLDIHGVRRLDFHTSVRDELKGHLMRQIETLAKQEGHEKQKKLKDMLEKSFPYIKDPALRPVVMCILKNMKSMDEKYIKLLVSDKSLYKECDIQVKRQIWHDNKDLFADEVLPLLSQYVSEKEEALGGLAASVAGESPSAFFGPTPKQRRQGAVVQRLLAMVDRSLVLYKMVVQFARNMFLRTQNAHYCTLRVDLLMALHDLEIQEITAIDRSHKFAWCLDACIREKSMDAKRSRELQAILEVKRGQEELLCDLAMTLCDPYAINFLGQSALKSVTHLINVEGMPRDNHVLVLLLRMLALGMEAWTMLNTENYTEPKLDVQLVTKFLPSLMCLMVDDQLRKLDSRTKSQDDQGSANANTDYSGPVPDTFQAYVQGNAMASVLAVFYVLHVARQRDRTGLLRVLGTLATAEGRRAYRDPFLHTLVGHLTQMADHFAREDFCMVIFDDFFLRGLRSSALKGNRHAETTRITAKHLMRLLWHVHAKLPPARLNGLVKKLQPFAQASEDLTSAYKDLLEKIKCVTPPAAGRGSENPPLPSSPALTSF
ncbi:negative elongation factor B-like [Dermacentor andersoni]|uniref:negative elongation factor B-like n=1 Tax=Dermacentor andersoni TaxID=34620 RepID=UPI0021555CCC|nr:negative elongation factor B-like [Dermacentor andersoni]